MRDRRKSTLKILDFLEQNMPIDDEEVARPRKPAPLIESIAGANAVDKRLVQESRKRREVDNKLDSPIDPLKRRRKWLIDEFVS